MADTDNLAPIPAVVLAGGVNDAEMKAATGVENRALVELSPGKTMLDYVIDALLCSNSVGEIVVVGDVPDSSDYSRVPSSITFLENLVNGVNLSSGDENRILVVTSDIPFITAAAVDDFVQNSVASGGDFCYPIIPMDVYRRTYASMKRTTLKLSEGEFTGGNIMMISKGYILDHKQTIFASYRARKDILALGRLLGWGLLFRVVISQTISPQFLDVRTLEDGVSRLLGHGAVAKAVVTDHASLGTDIDKPDDVVAARAILGQP